MFIWISSIESVSQMPQHKITQQRLADQAFTNWMHANGSTMLNMLRSKKEIRLGWERTFVNQVFQLFESYR